MKRREILDNLKNEDPDYVVDVLEITTEELLAKFPRHLQRYVESEVDSKDYEETDDNE